MVDIIGRAKVIAETLVDEQQAKKAGEKAGDAVAKGGKDAGTKFGDNFEAQAGTKIPKVALGLGIAAGTAIAAGIGESLQRDETGKRFAASLGLDAKDAAALNKSAAQIYKEAWGASFEDVQRGVAATKSSFEDLSGDALTEAARSAQIFADIFEVDVVEAAGTASVAVKQGLAKDAVEAFDLMTAAAQKVPLQFRDELQAAVTEYSVYFASLGVEGAAAFGLLAEGAQTGQIGIDKYGDAIKEFGIRVIDTSTSTAEAFATLKLDQDALVDAIVAGGPAGAAAFQQIIDALAEIKDPTEQNQTAMLLFGTQLEDIGTKNVPAFIDALANGGTSLKDFEGKTQEAGAVASETFTVKARGWGRSLNVYLGDVLDNIGGVVKSTGKLWKEWGRNIGEAVDWAVGKFKDFIKWAGRADDASPSGGGGKMDQESIDLLLGRGSAGGGRIGPGLRLVGENGPEIIRAGSSGAYVHNNSETQRMLDGSSGGDVINYWNFYGPESLSKARRDETWARTTGTRFGAATSAGV